MPSRLNRTRDWFGTLPGTLPVKANPGQNLPKKSGKPPAGKRHLGVGMGPALLGIGQDYRPTEGPGDPPPGFVGGTTSRSEWFIYWALTKLLGPAGDRWAYQQSYGGHGRAPGSAVIDFVIYGNRVDVGVRIQTFEFHIRASTLQKVHDEEQLIQYTSQTLVIYDIWEQDFIGDETGRAALHVCLLAINQSNTVSPIAGGRAEGIG